MTNDELKNNEDNLEDFSFEDTSDEGDEKSLKDKLKNLKEKLKTKTEEAKQNLDGWQRARAELVNKEKQLQNEKLEIYKQAAASVLEDLIPVLDSYEMARKNKQAWESVSQNWRMGVEYIFQQLINTTENAGLKKIEPKEGDVFDISRMHAIEEEETDSLDSDHKVSELVQTGYELGGKLLREAKVKIYIKK